MNPPVYWPDESLPVAIYCATGVLTGLETLATDALLAMPRTGLGIGGLLLGRQSEERIEILKTVEIACSHAIGPSFVLTPEELEAAKGSENGVDADNALVGLYCSKPNGRMALSDNEKALFDALCGERGHVALLIRPRLGHPTMAAFAIRGDGQNGDGFWLGTQGELVAPERVAPTPEVAAQEAVTVAEAPSREAESERVEPPIRVEPPVRLESPREDMPPGVVLPVVEEPMTPIVPWSGKLFGIDMSEPVQFGTKKSRWPVRLLIVVILIAILASAYLMRGYWLPATAVGGR